MASNHDIGSSKAFETLELRTVAIAFQNEELLLKSSKPLDNTVVMKSYQLTAVALAVFLSFCFCGCDSTRRGGAYRLAVHNQPTQSSAVAVETKDEEAFRRLLEQWLSSKRFSEVKFSAKRAVWRKRGAQVHVSQEAVNEVVVEFSAMGYTSDLRLSEQTERELLAYLEKQPGLKIAPTTSLGQR